MVTGELKRRIDALWLEFWLNAQLALNGAPRPNG